MITPSTDAAVVECCCSATVTSKSQSVAFGFDFTMGDYWEKQFEKMIYVL
ncbi:hypothetical protein Plhal304r1_c041g0119871 [Plasmopara halstedii]